MVVKHSYGLVSPFRLKTVSSPCHRCYQCVRTYSEELALEYRVPLRRGVLALLLTVSSATTKFKKNMCDICIYTYMYIM